MRTVVLLLTVVVFLLYADHGNAQGPGDNHRAAAEALLEVMDMEQMLTENTEAMLRMQQENSPELAPFADIMRDFMHRVLRWEDLKRDFIVLYTEIYTEDELRQLLEFYRTPIGQRVIATMPELMLRGAEISQRRLQEHLPELMERFMEMEGETTIPPGR